MLSRATQDSVGGALSEDVLSAAAEQLALLVGADVAAVLRHDADGTIVVGAWSVPGVEVPVGSRDPLAERLASASVHCCVEGPILVDDRVWGAVVAATKDQAPPETEKRVRVFAGLVAMAVANARKLEELERVPAEQTALRRLAALVARAAPPTEIFAAVAEEVGRVFGADLTGMSRYEADGTATTVAAWSARGAGVPVGFRSGLGGQNLSTIVRDTGLPARMEHYPQEASEAPPEVRALGIRSAVAVPITVEGRLWGAMNVGSTGETPPPPDTEARLVAFTELVATAIANSAAREELRSVAEEQAALRRVATLVAQAAQATEVFNAVVEEVGRVFGADLTGLNRFEPDETVTTVAAWSASGDAAPVGLRDPLGGNNLTSLVYLTGRPARIERYAEEATNVDREIFSFGIRSGVAVPVTVEGRLWGAVSVASTSEEVPPPDTEARLVAFTELVATAIANSAAREELRSVAEEQAALRRVATLVAQAAPPTEVFTAVIAEVGRVLGADLTGLNRFEPDETVTTTVAAWSARGEGVPIGFRHPLGGNNLMSLVYFTGKPARIERYAEEVTYTEEPTRLDQSFFSIGIRSGVAAPVTVGGRLWGAISVASRGNEPPPPDTEARLVAFTKLVGTAIANAQAQAELTASRARIIATADETRRRIERDLHDGAQQRLVSLALRLRAAQLAVPADLPELTAELDRMADGLNAATEELREYARGIHPALLSESGLRPALRALGRRSPVPVEVAVRPERRLPEQVEVCAYYIVSEALANAAKHSGASRVNVEVQAADSTLRVRVADDGVGGADFAHGSGLLGLRDRAEAIGGRLSLRSERGAGTTIVAELPLADDR